MFSSEFCKITKSNCFTEHLRKTVSGTSHAGGPIYFSIHINKTTFTKQDHNKTTNEQELCFIYIMLNLGWKNTGEKNFQYITWVIDIYYKVDSAFHPSKVYQMSTKNSWELTVKSKLSPRRVSVTWRQLNSIHNKK